jgi:hypothetical protein
MMKPVPFEGELYNDDRMFILAIFRATLTTGVDGTVTTTVHHDQDVADAKWCLVTFRNSPRYPAFRVDHFESLDEARAYMEEVEPRVPLVSLGGLARQPPWSYNEFVAWKAANRLAEYPIDEMYTPGNRARVEIFVTPRRAPGNE